MRDDESLKWRVITSEYIAQRPWLTVRRECLEMPNGGSWIVKTTSAGAKK